MVPLHSSAHHPIHVLNNEHQLGPQVYVNPAKFDDLEAMYATDFCPQ